jgi:hypothetical protein
MRLCVHVCWNGVGNVWSVAPVQTAGVSTLTEIHLLVAQVLHAKLRANETDDRDGVVRVWSWRQAVAEALQIENVIIVTLSLVHLRHSVA